MAFTEEQLEGYGLTPTDKSGDPNDGVVKDAQGNYYTIDNFDRQQKSGLDTDQGDVFDSSLEADARAVEGGDFDPSTYNTGNDVQWALQTVSRAFGPYDADDDDDYEPSREIEKATSNIDQYENDILSGETSRRIFGDTAAKKQAAQAYMSSLNQQSGPTRDELFNKYKLDIQQDMAPSVQSMLNAELAVINSPFKRSSGRDPQTQPLTKNWVFNNWAKLQKLR